MGIGCPLEYLFRTVLNVTDEGADVFVNCFVLEDLSGLSDMMWVPVLNGHDEFSLLPFDSVVLIAGVLDSR